MTKRTRYRSVHILHLFCMFLAVFAAPTHAQNKSGKIRGYKIYDAHVKVGNSAGCGSESSGFNAFVSLGTPKPSAISLDGLALDVAASFCSIEYSGHVDFLTFRDFQVNGLAVYVEEFRNPFQFSKDVAVHLPGSAQVVISGQNILKTAYRELVEAKAEWSITGTVLVFGK